MMIKITHGKEQFAHREFNVIQLRELSICGVTDRVTIRPEDINNLISALVATGFEEDILDAIEEYHMEFERT